MRILALAVISGFLILRTATPADIAAGKELFEDHCALCHGLDGGGGRGPDLRRRQLSHAPDDAALVDLIENGIPPEMPDAWYLSNEDAGNIAAFVRRLGNVPEEKLPGDIGRGQAVYQRSGCSVCHILAGKGVGIGPDLTDVGSRRGAARLREILVHPVSAMPDGFLLVEAIPRSGETIRGIRLNEDTFTIQIKDLQDRIYSLRKSELRELKKLREETPMPSYDKLFSTGAMEDIVAFLAAQRGQL